MDKISRSYIVASADNIERADYLLEDAYQMLRGAHKAETKGYDAMPEAIQAGDSGQKSNEAINNIEAAMNFIVGTRSALNEALSCAVLARGE